MFGDINWCLLWEETPHRYTQRARCVVSTCAQTSPCWEEPGLPVWERRSRHLFILMGISLFSWQISHWYTNRSEKRIDVLMAPSSGERTNCSHRFWIPAKFLINPSVTHQGAEMCQAWLTQWLKVEPQRKNPLSYKTNTASNDKLAGTVVINTALFPLEYGELDLLA